MYFELAITIFILLVVIFLAFWMTVDGTAKQKRKYMGIFARFIQKSARRAFLIFLMITLLIIPVTLFIEIGYWIDAVAMGTPPENTVPIVMTLLLMFLMLAGMIPVMWGRFRIWRQTARAAKEVKVRTTAYE